MSVQAVGYRNVTDVLDRLPLLVADMRAILRLTQYEAADQIGVSQAALSRFEAGRGYNQSTLVRVLCWLDEQCPADVRVQPSGVAA